MFLACTIISYFFNLGFGADIIIILIRGWDGHLPVKLQQRTSTP